MLELGADLAASRLAQHPAAVAWRNLRPFSPDPDRVETLLSHRGRPLQKSAVYRLHGAGVAGAPVIAKRAPRARLLVERPVYEEILPTVPLATVRYYGFVEEAESGFCWLFLGDAGERRYSAKRPEDRRLAAEWLGVLHRHTGRADFTRLLPPHAASDYLVYLRAALRALESYLVTLSADDQGRDVLEALAGHCRVFEARWPEIDSYCAGMPSCLVHGDLTAKNVRIHADDQVETVLAIDWETAGWGVPAPDLDAVDVATYWSVARELWPNWNLDDLTRLANFGTIFVNIGFVEAISIGLSQDWATHAASVLGQYEPRLAHARSRAGWS